MIIFQSHPIQYFTPLVVQLASFIKLKVYYYGGESLSHFDEGFGEDIKWNVPLLEGYSYEFLNNLSISKGMNSRFLDAVNLTVFKVIKESDDDIILINGWSYLSDWFVLIVARIFNKKIWIRSEMPWNQELIKPNSVKKIIKFFLFKYVLFKYFVDKFLFIGSQNRLFYEMHGVASSKFIYTPYSVDNNKFRLEQSDNCQTRMTWGIPIDSVVILYSGKLIKKKRPMDLLMAFQKLNTGNQILFFMGDGPLRSEIELYINDYKLDNVIISGFINQSDVSSIYKMADLFVMCSGVGETWGLSVNEAMNSSLPILISRTCGSSYDLVEDGLNGFVFDEGDVLTLSSYIQDLIDDEDKRLDFGRYSYNKILDFGHELSCINVISALG
jgi:glycosyltransferase involved in cell wall biosynthesis